MRPILASQKELSQAVQKQREAKLQDFLNSIVDSSTVVPVRIGQN